MVRKVSSNIYMLEAGNNSALVQITPSTKDTSSDSAIPIGSNSEGKEQVMWGKNDDKPIEMHRLATDSPTKWRLMETRRDFLVGNGIRFGIERPVGNKMVREFLSESHPDYNAIYNYLRELDKNSYFIESAIQGTFSGNIFTAIPRDKQKRADIISNVDVFTCRVGRLAASEKEISRYLINPNFGTRAFKKNDSLPIPRFNPAIPVPISIYHGKHKLPGQPFYSFAPWWGTKSWTEVANIVPRYHMDGLTNGYDIKYLIKMPDDYFDKEGLESEEEKEVYKTGVLTQMRNSLAGKKDKAIVTYYKYDLTSMRALPGVEIIPVKNQLTDDAYVSLFNTANEVQASGHGVQPTLAGINTGGKLGGSGKELEAAAMFQQKFMTYADRKLMLKPLLEVQDLNGWDSKIKFWFEDIEVYITDSTSTNSPANPNNNANTN